MCLDFPQVQSELFLSLDEILNCHANENGYFNQAGEHIEDHAPWENQLGLLVAEIFNNNKDLCIHIKTRQVLRVFLLSVMCFSYKCVTNQIEKMITRLAAHKEHVTSIMRALQYDNVNSLSFLWFEVSWVCRSLAKLHDEGIPLVRNQNTIIKQLMTYRKDIFEHTYIEEGTNPVIAAKRHKLLAEQVLIVLVIVLKISTSTIHSLPFSRIT
jgi:hypothetical protein